MFKLPHLKHTGRPGGIPLFKWGDVNKIRDLGSGSCSEVSLYTTKSSEYVAIKKTKSEFVRKFRKEATILFKLKHPNIVQLLSYSEDGPDAMMLENVQFDFSSFGLEDKVTSLTEFLQVLDNSNYERFEHFQPFIATGILDGLAYLHTNNIAHRDLKPHNILVSNQHYNHMLTDDTWKTSPVVVKLTDFGESRAELVQTQTLLHSKTYDLYRGSPVYMAPEIINAQYENEKDTVSLKSACLDDMKRMDVWSFAMIMYILLNPNLSKPYEREIRACPRLDLDGVQRFLVALWKKSKIPSHDEKYAKLRDESWGNLVELFNFAAVIDPSKRPDVFSLQSLNSAGNKKIKMQSRNLHGGNDKDLTKQCENHASRNTSPSDNHFYQDDDVIDVTSSHSNDEIQSCGETNARSTAQNEYHMQQQQPFNGQKWSLLTFIPLACSQSTVLEQYDYEVSGRVSKGLDVPEIPQNDATNACTFLALIICDKLTTSLRRNHEDIPNIQKLVDVTESALLNFPRTINRVRDKSRGYSADEALALLKSVEEIDNKFLLNVEIPPTSVHSSLQHMMKYMRSASGEDLIPHLFVSPPYSFLLLQNKTHVVFVDTHPVPEHAGGSDSGLVVEIDNNQASRQQLCEWLKERLGTNEDRLYEVVRITTEADDVANDTNESNFSQLTVTEDMEHISSDEDAQQEFWNNRSDIPLYEKGRAHRYSMAEAVDILMKTPPSDRVCLAHPLKVRENAAFIVDMTKYETWEDIKSDMNGVYSRVIRNAIWTVNIDQRECESPEIIYKRQEMLENDNQYHFIQHIKGNKVARNLFRAIFLLKNNNGDIVNNIVLLQYYTTKEEPVHLVVGAHGNMKRSNKPFYPSAKSVLLNISNGLKENKPGKVYRTLQEKSGGITQQENPGNMPRSKHQMYNKKWRTKKETDPVDDLLLYAKHKEDKIILHHGDVPHDLWVLGDQQMCQDVGKFTSSQLMSYPFSVDSTFNLGTFEVTPIAYKHLFLKSRKTGESPVFIGPTMIHQQKDFATFKCFSSVCVSNCPGLDKARGFITDGERALYQAFCSELQEAKHLRCFKHFEGNCKEKLRQIGITSKKDQRFFIEKVFGTNGKEEGILHAESEQELEQRLMDCKEELDKQEMLLVGERSSNYRPSFHTYLQSHSIMMKASMVGNIRRKAGMPTGPDGCPLRPYTNMSESLNNVLKRTKEEVSAKEVSKLQFVKDIFENIVADQRREMKLAIAGMSEMYELADVMKQCQVSQEVWFEMSTEERELYIERFNSTTIADAFAGKSPSLPTLEQSQIHEFHDLSINLVQKLIDLAYPKETAIEIQRNVLKLLNIPTAVQRKPSLNPTDKKKFEVATVHKKFGRVECVVNDSFVSCKCGCFKFDSVCKHSLAVAEKEGMLSKHMRNLQKNRGQKRSRTDLLEEQVDKDVAGKKGSKTKGRYKSLKTNKVRDGGVRNDADASESSGCYTEIHHNDNVFTLCFLSSKSKRCKTCALDFCYRQKIIPFDIVLEHKERWYFPVDGDWTRKRATNMESSRFYHPDLKKCIKPRFPYFSNDYLYIPEDVKSRLQQSHRDLLNREFGLNL